MSVIHLSDIIESLFFLRKYQIKIFKDFKICIMVSLCKPYIFSYLINRSYPKRYSIFFVILRLTKIQTAIGKRHYLCVITVSNLENRILINIQNLPVNARIHKTTMVVFIMKVLWVFCDTYLEQGSIYTLSKCMCQQKNAQYLHFAINHSLINQTGKKFEIVVLIYHDMHRSWNKKHFFLFFSNF